MEALQGAAVRVTPERGRADEWAVVLAATGIPHRLRRRPDGWALIVAPLDARAALDALDGYDREKQDESADTVADVVTPVGGTTVLGAAVALLLIRLPGRPRKAWSRPRAPPSRKRFFSRLNCRTLSRNALAPWAFVMRPASAALSNPARGTSFLLIMKVSMRGHFHRTDREDSSI